MASATVVVALGACTATVTDVGDDGVGTRSFGDDGVDGAPDLDQVPPPPPTPPTTDPECVPRDLAFWIAAPVWPTSSLDIAGTVYSERQLRAILTLEAHADASLDAAQALIVALLNQCAGCAVPTAIQGSIDRCDLWFAENVGWDFDGDGQIPYCIPPGDELAEPVRECRDALNAWSSGG